MLDASLAAQVMNDSNGKIGPNAILQVFSALQDLGGDGQRDSIAKRAGLARYLVHAPSSMIDEGEVVRLHQAVRLALPKTDANHVLREAGTRTAHYILAHRIPKLAQSILKALPVDLASRALLYAIAKHAWTFAGSGAFAFKAYYPATITLTDCPACTRVYAPGEPCLYYSATMQGLFRALVHPNASIVEQMVPDSDGRVRSFRLNWR